MSEEKALKHKVVCLECGATNLYPESAAGRTVRCGRCKSSLPVPGTVLEPSPRQFAVMVQESALPLLVDFYSHTCMPCRMMEPIVAGLARRRRGDLMVVKVNADQNRELAASLQIRAVPTFMVFRKGYEVGRIQGAMNETDFSLWVASKA
jgi:thioredoxin 2